MPPGPIGNNPKYPIPADITQRYSTVRFRPETDPDNPGYPETRRRLLKNTPAQYNFSTPAGAPSRDRRTPPGEQSDVVRHATNELRPFTYPMLDETHRKRAVDFTRALTAMKGKVGEIEEWRHKVASMAVICFGTHWEVDPPAVESVLRASH